MTTDPSNGRLPYGFVAQQRHESAFLAAEEKCACGKCKHEERLDSASRSQSALGAAAKYLSAGDVCKSGARVKATHRLVSAKATRIRQGGNGLSAVWLAKLASYDRRLVTGGDAGHRTGRGRNGPSIAKPGSYNRVFAAQPSPRRDPVSDRRVAADQQSLVSLTPKSDRVIRTEPVLMSDGRIHGVHVWSGPAGDEPPERPIPGPLKWDMTLGVATDTAESLTNMGRNVETRRSRGAGVRGMLAVG